MSFSDAISHYFFPSYSNNQKAKILHTSSLFIFIVFLVIFQVALQYLPLSGVRILGYAANISPEKVIELTNQKRAEIGLEELEYSSVLAQAAAAKGADMLEKDYWAHIAPDGTDPWQFFIQAGYKYRYAGENLARDFSNPEAAIEAWLVSPTHRENMLSSKYKEIGIAVVEGDLNGVDTTIIVQLFGTRYIDTVPQMPVASAKVGSAETMITLTPTPTVKFSPQASETPLAASVLKETSSPRISGRVLISPFTTTRGISVIAIIFLILVLIVDGIIISKRRISRISGRTFAHLAFLGMILAIALVAQAGNIL